MLRFIPVFFLLAAFVIPVHAARAADDNVIKVINEDGTVSVINIGPNAGAPAVAKPVEIKPAEIKPAEKTSMERTPPAPQPVPVPKGRAGAPPSSGSGTAETGRAEPAGKAAAILKDSVKESAVKEPAPEPAPAAKKSKKKKSVKEASVKKAKEEPPEPAKPFIPPGREVTREEAMAIAIDNSSMITRGLDAFPRTLDGRVVWVVVFKTDQGERDILVDRKTGGIVKVKK